MCQRNSLQLLSNYYTSATIIGEGNSLITTPPSNNGSFCTGQYGVWQSLNTTKFPFKFRMILNNPNASKTMFLMKLLDSYLFFVPKHHIVRISCTERTIIRRGRCYEGVFLTNNGCTRVVVESSWRLFLWHIYSDMLRSFVCKGDEKSQTEQM